MSPEPTDGVPECISTKFCPCFSDTYHPQHVRVIQIRLNFEQSEIKLQPTAIKLVWETALCKHLF